MRIIEIILILQFSSFTFQSFNVLRVGVGSGEGGRGQGLNQAKPVILHQLQCNTSSTDLMKKVVLVQVAKATQML